MSAFAAARQIRHLDPHTTEWPTGAIYRMHPQMPLDGILADLGYFARASDANPAEHMTDAQFTLFLRYRPKRAYHYARPSEICRVCWL